ncbi:MAG: hypothetical protein V3V08_19920 [Nannocystaceae bacterium]
MRNRWVYENLSAARVAPAGLVDRVQLGYRRQLVPRASPLWRESQASLKLDTTLTPAYVTLGPTIAVQPLTVVRVSASYQWVNYFGNFGNLQSYTTPLAGHSSAARTAAQKAGLSYATTGHQINLASMLQGRYGPAIVRAELNMRWVALGLRPGDRVHFDQYVDTIIPDHGFTAVMDADGLWELEGGWLLGARYSLVAPLFQAKHYNLGEVRPPRGVAIFRLGPAVLYRLFQRPGAAFDEPSLFAIAQWHLRHPYRTGEEVPAAIPTVMAGFMFKGDLVTQ